MYNLSSIFQDPAAFLEDPNSLHPKAVEAIFSELRVLARYHLRRERRGHTLDSVALVGEAYLKLARQSDVEVKSREHFFAMASRAMRAVLVDYARRRNAAKRGGPGEDVSLDAELLATLSTTEADRMLDLDQALSQLEAISTKAARVVECRFFSGLTLEETAQGMDVSLSTVRRRWTFARAWLHINL